MDRDAVERRGRARVAAVVARPDDDRRAEVERGVGRRPVVDAGAAADVGEVEPGDLDVLVIAVLQVDVDAGAEFAFLIVVAEGIAAAELADVDHRQVEELRVVQLLDVDSLLAEVLEQHALDQHPVERTGADAGSDVHADVGIGDRTAGHLEVGDDRRGALADAVDRIRDRHVGQREIVAVAQLDAGVEVVDGDVAERDAVRHHRDAVAGGVVVTRCVGDVLGYRGAVGDGVVFAERALDNDITDPLDGQAFDVDDDVFGVRSGLDADRVAAVGAIDRVLDRGEGADQVVVRVEQLDAEREVEERVGELHDLDAGEGVLVSRVVVGRSVERGHDTVNARLAERVIGDAARIDGGIDPAAAVEHVVAEPGEENVVSAAAVQLVVAAVVDAALRVSVEHVARVGADLDVGGIGAANEDVVTDVVGGQVGHRQAGQVDDAGFLPAREVAGVATGSGRPVAGARDRIDEHEVAPVRRAGDLDVVEGDAGERGVALDRNRVLVERALDRDVGDRDRAGRFGHIIGRRIVAADVDGVVRAGIDGARLGQRVGDLHVHDRGVAVEPEQHDAARPVRGDRAGRADVGESAVGDHDGIEPGRPGAGDDARSAQAGEVDVLDDQRAELGGRRDADAVVAARDGEVFDARFAAAEVASKRDHAAARRAQR